MIIRRAKLNKLLKETAEKAYMRGVRVGKRSTTDWERWNELELIEEIDNLKSEIARLKGRNNGLDMD